jgi:predicted nucleic acid-binding protein
MYLSSIVFMELRAGAHSKEATKAVYELYELFKHVNRVVVPTARDYERAGELIAKIQVVKGYNIRKSTSITNDCLIASSARTIGAKLYTQNRKDFEVIREITDFKVVFE